jgi:hypothetical protein
MKNFTFEMKSYLKQDTLRIFGEGIRRLNANPISIKIALKSLNIFYTLFMANVFEQWSEVDFK